MAGKGKSNSLMIILNKLDRREHITVYSLMNDLEVKERTIYRYIQTLQKAEFPIYFDKTRGSYAFAEGYSLLRPNFSVEEALALALSKNFLKSFGTGMEQGLNSIEKKISMQKSNMPSSIILSSEELPSAVGEHLVTIHQAIVVFSCLELLYRSLHSDEETTRTVDPYYVFFQDGFWYVRAYCHLRKDFRTFAVDRIVSLRTLDEHFIPEKISIKDELSGAFGSVIDGEPVEVVLQFDHETSPYIVRKRWHSSQRETKLQDGSVEVRFMVNGTEGVRRWIYQWIPGVKVVAPAKLRHQMQKDLSLALERVRL